MLELTILYKDEPSLFEAVLEPFTGVTEAAKDREAPGQGEISILFGQCNRVAVGTPYYENIINRLKVESKEIPHEILRQLHNYDFHFVSLSCSILPDNKTRFNWVRFGVELHAKLRQSSELITERPIAYDMFPNNIEEAIKCNTNIHLSPKIEFDVTVLKASIIGDKTKEKESILYEPEIIAFGLGTSKVSWDFKRTVQRDVYGNKRNLLLIVRTPKQTRVQGRFSIGAEIESKPPIRVTKRRNDIVDALYDLSE